MQLTDEVIPERSEFSQTQNRVYTGYEQELCPKGDYSALLQRTLRENAKLKSENEKLTEIFQFAVREFEQKNRKIAFLEVELEKAHIRIKELTRKNESLTKRLEKVEARSNLLAKMVFGAKSEKKENKEITSAKSKRRGAVKGHAGHGRKIPEDLPEREEIIDIPEDRKFCEYCGKPLKETGMEDVSSEICVEITYYVKRIKRKIYKKTCDCNMPIVTAAAPEKLIPKGKFGTSFWVDALINKYRNHLPIERQVSQMREYALPVSSGTIFGGFCKIYSLYLKALYEAMKTGLRDASHWHADESGWKLFVKIDGKGNYNWFVWVFISKDVALFVLHPTRSAKVPCEILFDMDIEDLKKIDKPFPATGKRINVDKFSSYKFLQRFGLVELAFCWTHQRREFIDMGTKYPELSNWVDEWIKRIAALYHINNKRIKYDMRDSLFKEYDKKLREKIDIIHSLINMDYPHPGQAAIMNSMKEHWKGLTLFVDNPEIPMDNNLAERTIRHMVLGRKNYWGNHAVWAGELTVAMFSIVQTCIRNNISPRAYLTHYFKECAKRGKAPPEDEIESFLPHKLTEDLRKKLKIYKPEILDDS